MVTMNQVIQKSTKEMVGGNDQLEDADDWWS